MEHRFSNCSGSTAICPGNSTVCSQAVLYNRTNLKAAVAFLPTNPVSEGVDLAISRYRREAGLVGHLVEPNMVRHIGTRSSMGGRHDKDRDKGDGREFLYPYAL